LKIELNIVKNFKIFVDTLTGITHKSLSLLLASASYFAYGIRKQYTADFQKQI